MAKDLLIRDVPPQIKRWIDEEREQFRLTQQEYVIEVLSRALKLGLQPTLFDGVKPAEPAPVTGTPFTFIDLFAGIGGLRIGLEGVGGKSVFSCEWDKNAQKTYKAWFNDLPHGDIREIKPSDIPNHDLLAAGFPCQPFSIAGVSKKNSLGRPHGFKDATQGTLFFHLASIIEAKKPPVLMLENVKNLRSHDKGRTWEVIRSTLEGMGYTVFAQVIDAAGWVPQHRERVFIIGFDKSVFGDTPPFKFPTPPDGPRPKFRDILESNVLPKYTLTDHLWKYLQKYAETHRAKGNGFGFGMTNLDGVSRTLSARYYKDGSEVLIPQEGKNPRRLTPTEARRLMGFPEHLPIVVSDMQAYRQFGVASVPPLIGAVATQVSAVLSWQLTRHRTGCLIKGRFPKRRA